MMSNVPDRTITVSRESLAVVLGVSRAALDVMAKRGLRTSYTEMAAQAQVELEAQMAEGARGAECLQ